MKQFIINLFAAVAAFISICLMMAFDEVTHNFFLQMLWLMVFGLISLRTVCYLGERLAGHLPDEEV